ncbi:MAG: ThiF family adenylyltransferase, partial [Clostridia bacterium]|nr:ThiF family adenylyltransferase [Clostridia bacterium]
MEEIFDREIGLIGINNFKAITNKKVIVFGCGGVGGYVIEMLVRSGISNLTIVDFDNVNITNINR